MLFVLPWVVVMVPRWSVALGLKSTVPPVAREVSGARARVPPVTVELMVDAPELIVIPPMVCVRWRPSGYR